MDFFGRSVSSVGRCVLLGGFAPLVETDPTDLLEPQPPVDRIAHLRGPEHPYPVAEIPGVQQRRARDPRPYPPPPGVLRGRDEVDPCDPRAEVQRRRRDRLSVQPPEVVAKRTLVAEAELAIRAPDLLRLDRALPEARP